VKHFDGIWATPPYLRSGSVTAVYDLLPSVTERPKVFYSRSREFNPLKKLLSWSPKLIFNQHGTVAKELIIAHRSQQHAKRVSCIDIGAVVTRLMNIGSPLQCFRHLFGMLRRTIGGCRHGNLGLRIRPFTTQLVF
jgi:hypothetical protein